MCHSINSVVFQKVLFFIEIVLIEFKFVFNIVELLKEQGTLTET